MELDANRDTILNMAELKSFTAQLAQKAGHADFKIEKDKLKPAPKHINTLWYAMF